MSGRRIVVAGTDTDVGKTIFSAALVGALKASYWKPIQAGLDGETDSRTVARLAGASVDRIFPGTYSFTTPCSPHRAAELDGIAIAPDRLMRPIAPGWLIIEGAGGVLVPVTRKLLYADILATWQDPVVLVARTALGTINHSLLSIEALRARDVPILGIAFVGDAQEDSEATIAAIGGVKRLGRLPRLDPLDTDTLANAFAAGFSLRDFTG